MDLISRVEVIVLMGLWWGAGERVVGVGPVLGFPFR